MKKWQPLIKLRQDNQAVSPWSRPRGPGYSLYLNFMNSCKKCYLCCLLGLSLSTMEGHSQESNPMGPLEIRSGSAEYNGREIWLKGDVHVQHSLGEIKAKNLVVSSPEAGERRLNLSLLKMEGDVSIEMHKGVQLECQQARVDSVALQGNFEGNSQAPDVVYTHLKAGDPSALKIKARRMQLTLARENQSKMLLVGEVSAEEQIEAFHQQLQLKADRADYKRLSPDETAPKGSLLLTAYPESFCKVKKESGEEIRAKSMRYNLATQQLTLTQAEGILMAGVGEWIHFRADEILWEPNRHTLRLRGAVQLSQEARFTLKTDHELEVVQSSQGIKTLFSSHDTEMTYWEGHAALSHKVMVYGPVMIDHEQLKVWLSSPKTTQGETVADKQVYLEDSFGDMYADEVRLQLKRQGKQLELGEVVLEGAVKILNRFDGHLQESSSVLHYALADQVDYRPELNEIMLSSAPGKRVLFLDKVNKVQMSAPQLKIIRGETQDQTVIQGMGDVRFTFIEAELNQLQKKFAAKKENR